MLAADTDVLADESMQQSASELGARPQNVFIEQQITVSGIQGLMQQLHLCFHKTCLLVYLQIEVSHTQSQCKLAKHLLQAKHIGCLSLNVRRWTGKSRTFFERGLGQTFSISIR